MVGMWHTHPTNHWIIKMKFEITVNDNMATAKWIVLRGKQNVYVAYEVG